MLPHVMSVNLRALRARVPLSESLDRYREVTRLRTGRADAGAEDGIEWTSSLTRTLKIPPLGAYGVREQDVPSLAENASRASSMKGNPVALTPDELTEILSRAL